MEARSSSTRSASCHSSCKPSCCAFCKRERCALLGATRTYASRFAWLLPQIVTWKRRFATATFRKDLFFRLNVVSIHIPPLRERRSDIPILVQCFLDRHAEGENVKFTPAAMKLLMQYDWPGNVRELENCISRALTLGDRQVLMRMICHPAARGRQRRQDAVACGR